MPSAENGKFNGEFLYDLSFTSDATASSTTVGATVSGGLARMAAITIKATIAGPTGGNLDLYFQVSHDYNAISGVAGTWWDYGKFPQLTTGLAAASYTINLSPNAPTGQLVTIGKDTTPAIGEGWVGGHWGDAFRILAVNGSGVSVGAAQVIKVYGKMPPGRPA